MAGEKVEKVLFEKLGGMSGEITMTGQRANARQPNAAMGLKVVRAVNSDAIVLTLFHNGRSIGSVRMTDADAREFEQKDR